MSTLKLYKKFMICNGTLYCLNLWSHLSTRNTFHHSTADKEQLNLNLSYISKGKTLCNNDERTDEPLLTPYLNVERGISLSISLERFLCYAPSLHQSVTQRSQCEAKEMSLFHFLIQGKSFVEKEF